jgi:hypothetical protein
MFRIIKIPETDPLLPITVHTKGQIGGPVNTVAGAAAAPDPQLSEYSHRNANGETSRSDPFNPAARRRAQ